MLHGHVYQYSKKGCAFLSSLMNPHYVAASIESGYSTVSASGDRFSYQTRVDVSFQGPLSVGRPLHHVVAYGCSDTYSKIVSDDEASSRSRVAISQ